VTERSDVVVVPRDSRLLSVPAASGCTLRRPSQQLPRAYDIRWPPIQDCCRTGTASAQRTATSPRMSH